MVEPNFPHYLVHYVGHALEISQKVFVCCRVTCTEMLRLPVTMGTR